MNISTFGDELLGKRLTKFEEEIKRSTVDDEEKEFALLKTNELRLFLGVLWLEFEKAFNNESPWFLIRDSEVSNVTILTKAFTDEQDPQPTAFKDLPITSVLLEVVPEEFRITFRMGTIRCTEVTILGSNAINVVFTGETYPNMPLYNKIMNLISITQTRYSSIPEPTAKGSAKPVTETISDTVNSWVEEAEETEKYKRVAFAYTIGRFENELPNCVDGGWSDWFEIHSDDDLMFYMKLWLNEEDGHLLTNGLNLKDMPENIISVTFSMKDISIDVCIGKKTVAHITFDDEGRPNPEYQTFDHDMYDDVYDTIQNIAQERT